MIIGYKSKIGYIFLKVLVMKREYWVNKKLNNRVVRKWRFGVYVGRENNVDMLDKKS